jgi:membrane-associated PAP2 superfamily phosphatase
MLRYLRAQPLGWTLLALAALLAWDATGLDLSLARLSGSASGFALRDHWFLVQVMHEGGKAMSWVLVVVLVLAIRWPMGPLRELVGHERAQLALTAIASVLLVSLVKHGSRTSCPWDLEAFGGVARHVSHWAWGLYDGGPGRCFPAGHASAAFAFVGGYFPLRHRHPAAARAWLLASLAAGLALGLGQQLRGAHFMSHTLWTGWLCWATGMAIDIAWARRAEHRLAKAVN